MTKTYCLRQQMTETINERIEKTKNGKLRILGVCSQCGAKQTKFIKGTKQSGYIGDALFEAGIKTLGKAAKLSASNFLKSDKTKNLVSGFVENKATQMIDKGVSEAVYLTNQDRGLISKKNFLNLGNFI